MLRLIWNRTWKGDGPLTQSHPLSGRIKLFFFNTDSCPLVVISCTMAGEIAKGSYSTVTWGGSLHENAFSVHRIGWQVYMHTYKGVRQSTDLSRLQVISHFNCMYQHMRKLYSNSFIGGYVHVFTDTGPVYHEEMIFKDNLFIRILYATFVDTIGVSEAIQRLVLGRCGLWLCPRNPYVTTTPPLTTW